MPAALERRALTKMFAYCVRRVLSVIPIVLIVVTIVFFAMRMMPGGPAMALLGDYASAEAVAEMQRKLGLDKPIHQQYFDFLRQISRGNLGVSIFNAKPVASELARAFPYTATLCLGTLLIGLLLGVPIGFLTATHRNSLWDYVGRVVSLFGLTIPEFYLAILLIILFSLKLRWFPMIGGGEPGNLPSLLQHLFLPALTVGIVMSAFVARTVRASLLEILSADYINTARAKGLRERVVLVKHAMRNALVPTIAFVGVYMTLLLGGAVVVEVVFSRAGWGRILINAMKQRDYPVLQSGLMVFAGIVVVVNLAVDLLYAYIDPRVRYS